jgi:hypothetical protein
MRYVITESKLESVIMTYLDDIFDVDDINWTNPYDIIDDETGEEGDDESRILFYIGDYNGDEDGCFMWYGCEYFDEGSKAKELCPIVQLEHPYDIKLDGYFGDKWHEPFKKWFTNHFELSVKTIE